MWHRNMTVCMTLKLHITGWPKNVCPVLFELTDLCDCCQSSEVLDSQNIAVSVCRVMLCISAAYAVMQCLSVCLSRS